MNSVALVLPLVSDLVSLATGPLNEWLQAADTNLSIATAQKEVLSKEYFILFCEHKSLGDFLKKIRVLKEIKRPGGLYSCLCVP